MTTLLRYLERAFPLIGLLLNRIRFPHLHVGLGVEIDGSGVLEAGQNVKIGSHSRIEMTPYSTLILHDDVSFGRNVHLVLGDRAISIGSNTQISEFSRIYGDVSIGRYCLFGPNVLIASSGHTFDAFPEELIQTQDHQSPQLSMPVRIFDDCWFGINVVISPGVTVGKGAVIGANSVVTEDVSPYAVMGGIPARLIKKRLEFLPPFRIDAGEKKYLPYFYDGLRYVLSNGDPHFIADGAFVLAMDLKGAKLLRLQVSGERAEIKFGNRRYSIDAQLTVLDMPLDTTSVPFPFLQLHATGSIQVYRAELLP